MYLTLYILALAALAVNLPAAAAVPALWPFAALVALAAAWIYGWGLIHLLRSLVYRGLVFPRRRAALRRSVEDAQGDAAERALLFPELIALMVCHREPAETTALVFRALILEAERYPGRLTVVAVQDEPAGQRLVKQLFRHAAPPERVRLVLVRRPAAGRPAALAAGLTAASRLRPSRGALLALLDGPTVLVPGTLERTVPFFALRPGLGALTTDQDAVTVRGDLFRAWRRRHFALRQLLLSSFALGDRLPPCGDRLLVLPARLALEPDLVALLRDGPGPRRRLGRRSPAGASETIWGRLAGRGLARLYVPDVRVLSVERPPARGFLRGSTSLLLAEAEKALRADTGRVRPGPARLGFLVRGYLLQRRLGIWMALVGPVTAALAACALGPLVLWAYLVWLMTLWLAEALALISVRDRLDGLQPLLAGYDRVWGSIVACRAMLRLHRPASEDARDASAGRGAPRAARAEAAWAHGLALVALVAGVAFVTGALPLPDLPALGRIF